MKISVVIPSYNNNMLLKKLLQQLREIPEFSQLVIVVVDNGSNDGTSDMVEESFPDIQLLTLTENSGGSGGFIAGVNHAMTLDIEYIWLLDDDVVIKQDTLSNLLESANKLDQEKVTWGAIGSMMANLEHPQLVVETGAEVNWRKCGFNLFNQGKRISDIKPEIKPVQYCAAASLLTRPAVIEKVGFFENVFIHFDDVEWCLRMAESGYNIFCNTTSVFWHATVKNAPVTWVRYYDCRNFLWLCNKYNRKWLYMGILRMRIKAFYFKLHRMHAISKLYTLGIQDAFSGRLRMRSELEIDEIIDVDEIMPELHGRKIIGIFRNYTYLNQFRKLHPEIMDNVEKVYFYKKLRTSAFCKKFLKLIEIGVMLRSSLYMLLHPKSLVVFDGNCYRSIMLPPLVNDTFYVFNSHKKAIRRTRNKK